MADDPYSRHYWRFADEFPDVFDDDHALALWHRLVRLADMAWPAAGQLPYGVRRSVLDRLVSVALIQMEGQSRFRIRGMDKERTKRSDHARDAAAQRWQYGRNAPGNARSIPTGNAQTMPSRAEPSKAETRQDEHTAREAWERQGLPHLTSAVQEAGEAITGRGILGAGDRQLTELDRLVESHGPDAVVAAMRSLANGEPLEWRQLVWGIVKRMEPIPLAQSARDQRADDDTEAARAESERRYRETQARLKDNPLYQMELDRARMAANRRDTEDIEAEADGGDGTDA